jgi:hypothetical protein
MEIRQSNASQSPSHRGIPSHSFIRTASSEKRERSQSPSHRGDLSDQPSAFYPASHAAFQSPSHREVFRTLTGIRPLKSRHYTHFLAHPQNRCLSFVRSLSARSNAKRLRSGSPPMASFGVRTRASRRGSSPRLPASTAMREIKSSWFSHTDPRCSSTRSCSSYESSILSSLAPKL